MPADEKSSIPSSLNIRLTLYIGLLLSETQILVNLKTYTSLTYFPYFVLAYFLIVTAHLLYTFLAYAFAAQRQRAIALELHQHIILPLSVLFFTLLATNDELVTVKITIVLLLILQSLMIVMKVIYFNTVVPQLAQISTLSKVIRVVKLNLIALLPLTVPAQLVVVIVLMLCQAVSLIAYFFKFTYQRIEFEYILLVGAFTGMISALENVIQTMFGFSYLFIGEIVSLYFYLYPQNYLKSLVELKYINNFSNKTDSKQDDDHLASFLFVNECLFKKSRSIQLSETAKNEGIIQASILLDRMVNPLLREDKYSYDCDQIIKSQVYHQNTDINVSLLSVYQARFNQTNSFNALEFLINRALQLQGIFINRALIIYYGHIERGKSRKSIFQRCKYQLLYERINAHIDVHEQDREEIKYIEFSDNLNQLNNQIQQIITKELQLIQYLADHAKKTDLFTDDRLLLRNQMKASIRSKFQECFSKNIYFVSNEFKFLYLLYEISIQKRYENLREQMKVYFLASEVQRLRYQNHLKKLVVLSGFNHGEIINSNQNFKNHFGITMSSFGRNNISQFIPSEKQRVKHSQMMNDYAQFRLENEDSHNSYQCLLLIQREINGIKLKSIEGFVISVRIYYENSKGFNYVCDLTEYEYIQLAKSDILLSQKDTDSYLAKGVPVIVTNTFKEEQLGESMELCEIDLGDPNLRRSSNVAANWSRESEREHRKEETNVFLDEKIVAIERKMMNGEMRVQEYPLANWLELGLLVTVFVLLVILFLQISSNVDSLSYVIANKQMPIDLAELVHNKLLLQQQIISLNVQTPYFPDNICANYGITSMFSYISASLRVDLSNNTDEFVSLITLPHNYDILDRNDYFMGFSSAPYLKSPTSQISYQKFIQLLKSQVFSWLGNLYSPSSFNLKFYQQTFPSIMLASTLDSPNSLSSIMDGDQNTFTNNLLSSISLYRVLACILVSLIAGVIIALRLRDSIALIDYLNIVESIKPAMLNDRLRELKSSLTQIHKLKANYIDNVEFSRDYVVSIKCQKKCESLQIQQFSEWHLKNKEEFQMQDELIHNQETNQFIKLHEPEKNTGYQSSGFFRIIIYNKTYLLVFVGLMVGVAIITTLILSMQSNRINTINLCDMVNTEMHKIQQKMINIVAYNWLKVYSLHTQFEMTAATAMFNQAVSSLVGSQYQTIIFNAYDKSLADKILYGNVCDYFSNRRKCSFYRSSIFSSGFSMFIPFVIKQELQTDQISANHSYYTLNLCDKTWLLYEGIIPMTTSIPREGFALMVAKSNEGFLSKFLQFGFSTFFLLVMTIYYQRKRLLRERIIRQQALSLDTVKNLYAISEFKPYFNQVYYS